MDDECQCDIAEHVEEIGFNTHRFRAVHMLRKMDVGYPIVPLVRIRSVRR
jgi:hypothetical protein